MRHSRDRKTSKRRRLRIERLEARAMLHGEGVISGSVYIDADGDGVRGAGEFGVPGVVVELSSSTDSSENGSTLTDDDGLYSFDELEAGTYAVTKRQTPAVGEADQNAIRNLVLSEDQNLGGIDFAEQGLRPEHISIAWFFASAPPADELLRETVARGEELAGNQELAASIRTGGEVPDDTNNAPTAADDVFGVEQGGVLTVDAAEGVLANDTDLDGDTLTASLIGQPSDGAVTLEADGSFQYVPDPSFQGVDSFTYRASDGVATSDVATVTINVNVANRAPVAEDDDYEVAESAVLSVGEAQGVLANDTDLDGDTLSAVLVDQASDGVVALSPDGSFTYTPDAGFSGDDSFTYRADDGAATSAVATVRITVTPTGNELFGPVTPGSFESAGLLGIRTDLVAGAPAVTSEHVDGDIDYTGYSNPPTYGPHHGFDPQGVDVNPGITPRPTGVYTTEQPEEDLIHNLEHGHVWISYDPGQISAEDLAALEQLVRDGSPNANGGGVGVILTPRAANDTMIALASWARLLTLDSYDPDTIRSFVETNRGKAPEGFITP